MGSVCSSDAYDGIVKNYGQMFTQMVMAEKAKQHIGSYFDSTKTQTQSFFKQYETETLGQMDSRIGTLNGQFGNLQQTLASKLPGGLQSLGGGGNSLEETMGLNGVMGQLTGLREDTKMQIDRQLAQATAGLTNMQSQTIGKINESQPNIPEFSKLSQSLQRSLFDRASNDFGQQINQNNSSIMQQIAPAVAQSLQGYKGQLTSTNPMQKVNGIIGGFQSSIANKLKGMLPQNVLSTLNLGSMFGGLGGIGGLGNIPGGLGNMTGGLGNMTGGLTNGIIGDSNRLGGVSNTNGLGLIQELQMGGLNSNNLAHTPNGMTPPIWNQGLGRLV